MFNIASQAQAAFCLTYAIHTFDTMVMTPPAGIPSFVPPMYLVVCAFMTSVAAYLCRGPSRQIKTITAIPKLPNAETVPSPLGRARQPELTIRIEMQRWLPGLMNKRYELDVGEVELMRSVGKHDMGRIATPNDLRVQQYIERQQERQRELESKSGVMKLLGRVRLGMGDFVQNFGRVWTRMGMEHVAIGKKLFPLKLDVRDGEMLDKGHALDQLFMGKGQK